MTGLSGLKRNINMMDGYVIKTERLRLREIRETDTEAIVRLRSDPAVYKFFKAPHRITDNEHMNWFYNTYSCEKNLLCWMCEKDSEYIGFFGLKIMLQGEAEVSYLLDRIYQHKGYASEAMRAVISWAASEMGIKKYIAIIHKENIGSLHFIESLGFRMEKKRDGFVKYSLLTEEEVN